jgi:hypothetical protein
MFTFRLLWKNALTLNVMMQQQHLLLQSQGTLVFLAVT